MERSFSIFRLPTFADLISTRDFFFLDGWERVELDSVTEMDDWGGVKVEGDGTRAGEAGASLILGRCPQFLLGRQ